MGLFDVESVVVENESVDLENESLVVDLFSVVLDVESLVFSVESLLVRLESVGVDVESVALELLAAHGRAVASRSQTGLQTTPKSDPSWTALSLLAGSTTRNVISVAGRRVASQPNPTRRKEVNAMKKKQAAVPAIDEGTLESYATQLDNLATLLGQGFTPLSSKERVRLRKPRKGGPKIVPTIATLCKEYGVGSPSAPTDDMTAFFAEAASYEDVSRKAHALAQLVDDLMGVATSKGWSMATANYRALSAYAVGNPQLATDLEPVKEVMKTGKRTEATDTKQSGASGSAAEEAKAETTASENPTTAAATTQTTHA